MRMKPTVTVRKIVMRMRRTIFMLSFARRLRFCFGFQLHVAVGDLDRVFDVLAMVLLANLFGLFLDEGGEGVDAAADVLSGFLLGRHEGVVEALDLLVFRLVYAVERERLRRGASGSCGCGMAHAVNGMVLRLVLVFGDADSLDRKQGVLRTAVAFLADAGLLAPQVAVDGVALGHFVVAIALGEIHASTIGKLPQ